MWYDATSAVSVLEDPASSTVVGKIGYAFAPKVEKAKPGWLYSWALGIPKSSDNPEAAWKFISWMTSKGYLKMVGETLGWARVPPGSRLSTYEIPEYKKAISKSYGPLTLESIEAADPGQADRSTGALHRSSVRGHPRVPGSRHPGQPADQRGHRRPEVGATRRWSRHSSTHRSSARRTRRSHDHC